MSHFLYFLPHETPAVDSKKIAEAGLAHAFESPPIRGAVASGPDGNPGALLSASGPEKIGFHPDTQTWKRFPRGAAWVGFYNEDPPTPAELQRKGALGGHPLELLDGREWTIPLARQFRDEGETFRFEEVIPRYADVNDDGDWIIGDVLPKYKALFQLSDDWFESWKHAVIFPDEEKTVIRFDFKSGILDSAEIALSTNYRLSKIEIAALKLIDDSDSVCFSILNLTSDIPMAIDFFKKKQILQDITFTNDG